MFKRRKIVAESNGVQRAELARSAEIQATQQDTQRRRLKVSAQALQQVAPPHPQKPSQILAVDRDALLKSLPPKLVQSGSQVSSNKSITQRHLDSDGQAIGVAYRGGIHVKDAKGRARVQEVDLGLVARLANEQRTLDAVKQSETLSGSKRATDGAVAGRFIKRMQNQDAKKR